MQMRTWLCRMCVMLMVILMRLVSIFWRNSERKRLISSAICTRSWFTVSRFVVAFVQQLNQDIAAVRIVNYLLLCSRKTTIMQIIIFHRMIMRRKIKLVQVIGTDILFTYKQNSDICIYIYGYRSTKLFFPWYEFVKHWYRYTRFAKAF